MTNELTRAAEQYLTANEYAQIKGITSRAVRIACESGRLNCVKLWGMWLIWKEQPEARGKKRRGKKH